MEDERGAAVECREWTGQRRRSQFDGFGAAVGRGRGADAHGQSLVLRVRFVISIVLFVSVMNTRWIALRCDILNMRWHP